MTVSTYTTPVVTSASSTYFYWDAFMKILLKLQRSKKLKAIQIDPDPEVRRTGEVGREELDLLDKAAQAGTDMHEAAEINLL